MSPLRKNLPFPRGADLLEGTPRGGEEADSAVPTIQPLISALLQSIYGNMVVTGRTSPCLYRYACPPCMWGTIHYFCPEFLSQPYASSIASFNFNIIVFSNANLFTQDRRGTAVDKNTFVLQRTGRFPGHPWLPKVTNH